MPTAMKTAKKATGDIATSKKANLASKAHEELLGWLVEIREIACDIFFRRDEEWFSATCKKAIEKLNERNQSLIGSLERGSQDESLPSEYRNACAAKLKSIRPTLRKAGTVSVPGYEGTSSLILKSWSVQAPILTEPSYVNGRRIESKQVGFVDLQVFLEIPNDFEVACFGSEGDSAFASPRYANRADAIERIATLDVHAPKWAYSNPDGFKCQRVWFDVWAEPPAIGELLQHLKILRDLNKPFMGANGRWTETSIVLVVPSLSERIEEIVEHEGFNVLSKAWYDDIDA